MTQNPVIPRPTELFVSWSDESLVDALMEVLDRHDVPFWCSRRSLEPGVFWTAETLHALRRCDWMVVLMTPKAAASRWVRAEMVKALSLSHYTDDRIIPLLYESGDLDGLWPLEMFQRVDFTASRVAGYTALLARWSIPYRP